MNTSDALPSRQQKPWRAWKSEPAHEASRQGPSHICLAQTRYLGTIGVMLVSAGRCGRVSGTVARQLDPGYSVRWTVSMIFLGVVVGGVNVYLFVRE